MSEEATVTRNPVKDGVYDCTVTGVRRQEKHFGKDALVHFVLSVGVRKADDEKAEIFYAELPVVFTPGQPWDFYDKATNKSVTRKCTTKDVQDQWSYVEKIFPEWKRFNDEESDGFASSIAWFDSHLVGQTVRAKLKNREYTDGSGKVAHDATLYAANSSNVSEGFAADFGKALAASGIKIGKAAKSASGGMAKSGSPASLPAATAQAAAAPAKPQAPAPKKPVPPPAKTAKVYTADDAWAAYEEHQKKVDPNGEKYWDRVAETVGKDASEWESFTSEDWEKCVNAFCGF